jgi:hypothetical protein
MAQEQPVPNLSRILNAGVPPDALAFYGRWWQLETWLRELVYVELRAKYGADWTTHLEDGTRKRAGQDQANLYMASADAGELLAYTDVRALFELVERNPDLFKPVLPPLQRWQDEMKELRNRNAHCRRPHRDDLARVEQMLRDLEPGAWRFYVSYLDTQGVPKSRDPLAKSWVARRHEVAARLLGNSNLRFDPLYRRYYKLRGRPDPTARRRGHAYYKYDTLFRLSYSVRPWATPPDENAISGSEGVLWHAHWAPRGVDLNVTDLWRAIEREPQHRDLLVHLLVQPLSVTATFAAVDDPSMIADAIGYLFDTILETSIKQITDDEPIEAWVRRWTGGAELLPRRIQVDSPLTHVDPNRPHAFSIFDAAA